MIRILSLKNNTDDTESTKNSSHTPPPQLKTKLITSSRQLQKMQTIALLKAAIKQEDAAALRMHTRTLTGMQINTQGVVNAGRKQIFVPVQTSDTAIITTIVTATVLHSSEHAFHRFNDVPGELIAVSVLKAVDLTCCSLASALFQCGS